MEKDTKQLIIMLALVLTVVLLIFIGTYLIFKDSIINLDPCSDIKGCEYFQCKADHESLYNAINMNLLKKQNCLLEELNKNGVSH